jgi:hypothetical protein
VFLAISAGYHLVLGLIGLAIDQTFPWTAAAAARHSDHIFGVLETNGWHSVAAVGLGLLSLLFVLRPQHARAAALGIGISQALVTVSFSLWAPTTFLFAANGADQVIHSFTALGGLAAGLMTRPDAAEAP